MSDDLRKRTKEAQKSRIHKNLFFLVFFFFFFFFTLWLSDLLRHKKTLII